MEQLKLWAKKNNLMNNETIIFGIAHDNPQIIPRENCRYDACIILTDKSVNEKESVQIGEICAGKYAVFTIEHTAEAMAKAWIEIFQKLAEMGYILDSARPILERYAVKQVVQHHCEICVPIC